jgi:hypothetical protein
MRSPASYVSDWGTQGLGVFFENVSVSMNAEVVAETSFETDLGGWTGGRVSGELTPTERNQFVTRSMDYLLGAPSVNPAAVPAKSAVAGSCSGICPFGPDAARPIEPLLFQTDVMHCRAR